MMRLLRKVRSAAGSVVRFGRHHAGWTLVILGALLIVSAIAPLFSVGAQRQRQREVESADLIKKRAEWFFRQRAYPLGFVPAGAKARALEHVRRMREAQGLAPEDVAGRAPSLSTSWTAIGPQPTTGDPFFGNTSGRVTALALDTCDTTSKTLYLGGADGGIWKTTDGGNTWTPLTDTQLSLSTGSIALDSSTCVSLGHSIVYVGTGEENNAVDNLYGAGVLISTDGGATWTHDTTFTPPAGEDVQFGGPFIGALAVDPASPQVLLAAVAGGDFLSLPAGSTPSGTWRSTNGGASWTRVFPTGTTFGLGTDVVFDPKDATGKTAYAALGLLVGDPMNGVFKSTDGGMTWTSLNSGLTKLSGITQAEFGRITLALGPSASGQPSVLYASIANAQTPAASGGPSADLLGLFKSTDGGTTWTQLSATPDFCQGQCWYDMPVRVSPTTAATIFVGGSKQGTILWRSTDGGTSWHEVSGNGGSTSIHVDVHALLFTPDGNTLYVGNDGGVWNSTNVTNPNTTPGSQTWTDLNNTLEITQFYPSVSIHPTDRTQGFGGTQDNGTQRYTGSLAWANTNVCGDGGWTLFDPTTPANVYLTCVDVGVQGGGFAPIINKSSNGGGSFSGATSGITISDNADFIPPLVVDSKTPADLYFGTFRLYQTTNGATNWIQMAGGKDLTSNGTVFFITTMAVAPSDSNTVYVGTVDGLVQVTTNALNGASATFTNVTNPALPPRSVTNLAVDPTNPMIAYVTFSGFSGFVDFVGHVFKTTNGGAAWTDISCTTALCNTPNATDLPNIPANDIAVDPADATGKTLDVATDVGVFQTTDGGAHWAVLAPGLPHSEVLSLRLQNPQRVLRAGTHGRGVWDLQLAVTPGFSFGAPSPPTQSVGAGGATQAYTIPVNSVGGFSGSVTLSCSGLPTGATCNFGTNPVSVPAGGSVNATFTISTTLNTPPGTSTVMVAGTSGALTPQQTTVMLTVTVPFNFGTPSPPTASVAVNQTAMFTIPVNSTSGFNSPINLACAPTPATSDFTCAAANFNPNPVTPPANGSTNTVLSITPTANALVPVAPAPKMPLGPWVFLVATLAAVLAVATKQFGWTRRRVALGFSLALAVALLATLSACSGGGGGTGTGPQSHTFTITITGTSGSLSNTQTVKLTIHP